MSEPRPLVDLPPRSGDHPVWARVGVIATLGFLIGIAWPRLAGVRLGPVPPDDTHPVASASSSSSARAKGSAAPLGSALPPAALASTPNVASVQTVVVGKGQLMTCRNRKGKANDTCDAPDFDSVALPKLRALAKCPAALGLNGKLSIGLDVDFPSSTMHLVRGKSSNLPSSTFNAIWQCAEQEFSKVELASLKHEYSRYTVFYNANFYPPGKLIEAESPTGDPSTADPKKTDTAGSAQIVYDTVLVRDDPKNGAVVARLVRGARVSVQIKKGDWYKIKFGDREGWIYRGAVGQ